MRVNKEIINAGVKLVESGAIKDAGNRSVATTTEFFQNSGVQKTVEKAASKIKTRFFTKAEMLDMKPSEFKKVMESRTDIPEAIKGGIVTPEKLNLFDEVIQLEAIQKMEPEAKEKFLNKLFGQFNQKTNEASAQLEVIPDLIKKGYDPLILADLPITHANKEVIAKILQNKDLPKNALEGLSKVYKQDYLNFPNIEELSDFSNPCNCNNIYRNVVKIANISNYKYIEDCLRLTGNPENLPYWGKDTTKILREFLPDIKGGSRHIELLRSEILDRLYRNGHTYESVRAIFGDKQMTAVTQRLLEYKNFNKFKNIGLEEFDKLSVDDKKEFIRGYISALTPKELLYPGQSHLETGLEELQNSMKIYRELNPETTETLVSSYNNTLRSLLNKLPESERKVIRSTIDTKFYRRQYRLDNPIPSLVDEIGDVLKVETRTINGRTVKYAEMNRNFQYGLSTHRMPSPESILTIEALEETVPNMLLCVGTKGYTQRLNIHKKRYGLIVKPRKASDWHVQAYSDIDSGNNATKNIYNFEHIMLPHMGNHCDAIDLVPNAIKKELNLSQREYTSRMKALKGCRTLGEIGQKDPIMEKAIRKVIKEQNLYEGLMRPETMGVTIPMDMPLEEVSEDIINYCIRRDIPIVRVIENPVVQKAPVRPSLIIEV